MRHSAMATRERIRHLAWVVVMAGLAQSASAASGGCGSDLLSAAQARAAVAEVLDDVSKAHYVAAAAEDEAVISLRRLMQTQARPIRAARLSYDMNAALAKANDGHLRIDLPASAADRCGVLPLELAWTDDGLLVRAGVGAPPGSRVLSLGGRRIDDLAALAEASIPHENVYWARSDFARKIVRADWIGALTLARADGAVPVTYESPEGSMGNAALAPGGSAIPPEPAFAYRVFPEDSTGVMRIGRCDPSEEFFRVLGEFAGRVESLGLHKVAIDLRGNPGGDSSVALAVFSTFARPVPRGFSVEVRVSRPLLEKMPIFAPSTIAPVFKALGFEPPAAGASRYLIPPALVIGELTQRLGGHAPDRVSGRDLYLLTDGGTFSSAALFAVLARDNHI
ncbi:MAG TPA: S41 family peptidase, partial [Steroidobacteraceae bacterium]|nr:S41 family peptidase [Steroidobacteraceae bacterium]